MNVIQHPWLLPLALCIALAIGWGFYGFANWKFADTDNAKALLAFFIGFPMLVATAISLVAMLAWSVWWFNK